MQAKHCNFTTNDPDNMDEHIKKHTKEQESVEDKPKTPRPQRKRKLLESFEEDKDELDDSVTDKHYIPTNKDDDISDDDDDDELEDIKCTKCNFQSYWERDVEEHMKEKHKSTKKTKLDTTNNKVDKLIEKATKKPTKTSDDVPTATKKRTNNKVVNLTCDECGKTYSHKGNLTRHMVKMHFK